MDSLKGKFLLATNQMPDPRFAELVIYICSHNHEGAMGLVVNNPSEHALDEVFESANLPFSMKEYPPVYIGGPVEPESAFFLHTSLEEPLESSMHLSDNIFMSRDPELLKKIGQGEGPDHYLFLVGYAGWGPGQLETELSLNGWLNIPASEEILFRVSDELKWKKAAEYMGIDISLYTDEIGLA